MARSASHRLAGCKDRHQKQQANNQHRVAERKNFLEHETEKTELNDRPQRRDAEATFDAEPERHRHHARRDNQHGGEDQLQRSEFDEVAHATPFN